MMLALDTLVDYYHADDPQAESSASNLLPCFFGLSSYQSLLSVLSSAHHVFMEIGHYTALDISLTHIMETKPDFALCLTSQSAYREPMAQIVLHTLAGRFGLTEIMQSDISLALHEIIVNAVVHGNLGIQKPFADEDELYDHYGLIDRLIGQEPHSQRRVTVCAWQYESQIKLSIADQGSGFTLPPAAPIDNHLPCGRGIHLARSLSQSLWLGEDARTVSMIFNYR